METNVSSANDTRLRETLDVMAKLASGDLDARVAPSHRGDELDGVMTGLNVLAEQMSNEIGERKRAEEGLRESEEKLTAFMDNLPGTAFLKDASGGYTYVNRMYEDTFAIKKAEWLGKTDEELFPPDIAEQYRSNDRKVLETGRPVQTIEPALREGDVRHWLAYKFPIFDEAGVPVIVGGIGLDVTEYERSKERLQESEERYRALVEAAGDAIYMKDAQGRYTTVNPEFERIAGKSSSELEGKTARDMFPAPVGDEAFRVDTEILNTGVTVETEGELGTQAGPRTYLSRKVPTRDRSGQVVGLVGISRDITERKQAETELRESEERYRTLVEAASDAIYVKDTQGCYTLVNSEVERRLARLGVKASGKDEIYGKTSLELFGEPLGAKIREADMEALKTGIPVDIEVEVATEDGSLTFLSREVPLKDENGQVTGLLGISRDITERKHTEEAQRESELRFRQLAENIREVFWVIDADDYRYLYISPAYEEIWGRTCESLYEQPLSWMEAIHPADRERMADTRRSRDFAAESHWEYRIVRADGSVRWIVDRGYPVLDEAGQVYRVAGIAEDITERKRAETELAESEERYRVLVEAAGDSIYVKDAQGRYAMVNSEFERRVARLGLIASDKDEIYGKTSSELFGGPLGAKIREADLEVLKTGTAVETELEVPTQDRSWTHFSRKVPLKDENGQVIGLLGISRDITERKHLQEQLTQAQKMESVGRLASGVAHDFNNMLTVIINYTHLATTGISGPGAVGEYLREVQVAAERASRLTSQLLAFSRRQVIAPRVLDLN